MHRLSVHLRFTTWEIVHEYKEGYLHPEDVKEYSLSLEKYIRGVFDALDINQHYRLSPIKNSFRRIDEEAGEVDAPYEFRVAFKVGIIGSSFDEVQFLYNALDYLIGLIRLRHKFQVSFEPDVTLKPFNRR